MHSLHLAELHTLRRLKHGARHVHCCHVGDVTEGAVELLYVVSPFLLRDRHRNTCSTISDRVENKHINNSEEYRTTREVPLPYRFDALPSEEEAYIARLQLRKRSDRLS